MTVFAKKTNAPAIALLQSATCNLITAEQLTRIGKSFSGASDLEIAELKAPRMQIDKPLFT